MFNLPDLQVFLFTETKLCQVRRVKVDYASIYNKPKPKPKPKVKPKLKLKPKPRLKPLEDIFP
jgi:hypothetical protein